MTPMHHHRLIRCLVLALRQLRMDYYEVQGQVEDGDIRAERTRRQLHDAQREIRHAQLQAREDDSARYQRECDRDGALHDLANARAYHDEWAEARALRRLKSL